MKKEPGVYLEDILTSCDRIFRYVGGMSEEDFLDSEETQDAVVRRFEIIGEAVKRLPREYREAHGDIEWDKAAGMRDMLIHAYDEIKMSIVWRTIHENLPEFRDRVASLLEEINRAQ